MPKGKRAALFCCLFCAAVAFFWPGSWNQPLQRQQINQWIRGKRLSYQGTLQVWYVSAGASGAGDGSAWVRARMQKFEKNHFGIFYQMQTMDSAALNEKLDNGERPDLIFFGKEQIGKITPLLQACDLSATLLPAFENNTAEGKIWPVFYGGYAILVNEQALYSVGLSPPLDLETMDETYLQQVTQALPHAFAYQTQQAGLAAVRGPVNAGTQALFANAAQGTKEQFLKEEIAFYACPISTWYTLENMSNTQAVPSYQAFPISNFAVDVQYMGMVDTQEESKQKACTAVLSFFLNEYSQQALQTIGALPVIQTKEPLSAEGNITGAVWQQQEAEKVRLFSVNEQAETFYSLCRTQGHQAAMKWLQAACNES